MPPNHENSLSRLRNKIPQIRQLSTSRPRAHPVVCPSTPPSLLCILFNLHNSIIQHGCRKEDPQVRPGKSLSSSHQSLSKSLAPLITHPPGQENNRPARCTPKEEPRRRRRRPEEEREGSRQRDRPRNVSRLPSSLAQSHYPAANARVGVLPPPQKRPTADLPLPLPVPKSPPPSSSNTTPPSCPPTPSSSTPTSSPTPSSASCPSSSP